MKTNDEIQFGSKLEALMYPLLFLIVLWLIQILQELHLGNFVTFGVFPREIKGLVGLVTMPLIHSPLENVHLLNNSLPAYFLLAALIYLYRKIALKVFILSWILTGLLVWIFAENNGAYHIGFSGVIYALAAFLFFSGYQRKYLPLQAMALFVAFVYGSMVWGIFPTKQGVSWEGHLSGLIIGTLLSVVYLKKGPSAPKYQYEIEKELGIEPPDFEGMYWEKVRIQEELEELEKKSLEVRNQTETHPVQIQYFYKPNGPKDETDRQ